MSVYEVDENAIRLLAGWVLLVRSEQALSKGPRTPADSAQAEGGQLTGWPPAPAPSPDIREESAARSELVLLLARECAQKSTAQETRRIAELLEYLDRSEDAIFWWQWAAARGDEDARDYLDILNAGMQDPGNVPVGFQASSPNDGGSAAMLVWKAAGVTAGSDTFAAVQLALSAAASPDVSEEAKRLVKEIEEYLQHPDRMTDGRRR
ncbi:hypothetical protein [Streptomyces nodosus]|uniref:hypothetical protein n=1 Tax=Streptomyces nodosus TaxID=40318 RepID=UPI001186F924|nr:hypothetical protein [Streptomyces nodosus]MBB4789402.1 hypothetical protein [Streptomyces nodosus]